MDDYQRTGLSFTECQAFRTLLDSLGYGAGIDTLYWLPLPLDALSPLQQEHIHSCGPYALAVEVHDAGLNMELLIRARNSLCCDCIHAATPEVAARMQTALEQLLATAGISPLP